MHTDDKDKITKLYKLGVSTLGIKRLTNLPISSIRNHLKRLGILRDRFNAAKNATEFGRNGKNKGKKINRRFPDVWKKRISEGRKKSQNVKRRGFCLKQNGYIEITIGENAGRGQHRVLMEMTIGRKLQSNECVHHKDGNRANNALENLEIMTRSDHTRHHRLIKKEKK